jgi:hypothetical protein
VRREGDYTQKVLVVLMTITTHLSLPVGHGWQIGPYHCADGSPEANRVYVC